MSAEGSQDTTGTLKSQFLYTTEEHVAAEIKNTVLFTITPKKIKFFGIHQTKHLHNLITGKKKIPPPNADKDTETLYHSDMAGTVTLETGLEVPSKIKTGLTIQLSNCTLGIYPREIEIYFHVDTCT